MDLLNVGFLDLCKPGIISLSSKSDPKSVQLLHSRSIAKLMCRIIEEFNSNQYRNRDLQNEFNAGTLDFKLIEYVESYDMFEHDEVFDLILRYRTMNHCKRLNDMGYTILNSYAPVQLTSKVMVGLKVWTESPQVVIETGKGRRLFVQKPFNTVFEAEEYRRSTNMEQMILDTKGRKFKFQYVVPLQFRKDTPKPQRRRRNRRRYVDVTPQIGQSTEEQE